MTFKRTARMTYVFSPWGGGMWIPSEWMEENVIPEEFLQELQEVTDSSQEEEE